ncbi:DUF1049 domain-containing protein [Brevirhabdus pacifica]|uniref:DUF1049 domain-containing protein n=1 Tax=Brevirhabdus pacifica TaxID=1267768 RepID=A0A1U7DKQ0_9RHOB|nr:lipopolysaccharide assembly protein LapA domain-containing protein [Brevirhabdus pacifica]APX90459.1 DUF1049 domain-containing protein [Brevirhabdus pacifica]OWU78523.1 phosphoribosylanthranilate isomerase [Loktanella sp. 22II-4b]PJJ85440.1 uncharacterized protein DUF1049 [Brevirhabdus pacifica]
MHYIKFAFLALIGIVLLMVALANRGMVALRLLPEEMADLLGFNASINLPLFIVILGFVLVGLFIGFFWEWAREYKYRAAASSRRRRAEKLERENERLRQSTGAHQDEVLALLENGARKG